VLLSVKDVMFSTTIFPRYPNQISLIARLSQGPDPGGLARHTMANRCSPGWQTDNLSDQDDTG